MIPSISTFSSLPKLDFFSSSLTWLVMIHMQHWTRSSSSRKIFSYIKLTSSRIFFSVRIQRPTKPRNWVIWLVIFGGQSCQLISYFRGQSRQIIASLVGHVLPNKFLFGRICSAKYFPILLDPYYKLCLELYTGWVKTLVTIKITLFQSPYFDFFDVFLKKLPMVLTK